MKHQRKDYNDRVKCVDGSIPEDEPVFLLRGKDPTSQSVIKYWVELNKHKISEDNQAEVLAHAQSMSDYEFNLEETT